MHWNGYEMEWNVIKSIGQIDIKCDKFSWEDEHWQFRWPYNISSSAILRSNILLEHNLFLNITDILPSNLRSVLCKCSPGNESCQFWCHHRLSSCAALRPKCQTPYLTSVGQIAMTFGEHFHAPWSMNPVNCGDIVALPQTKILKRHSAIIHFPTCTEPAGSSSWGPSLVFLFVLVSVTMWVNYKYWSTNKLSSQTNMYTCSQEVVEVLVSLERTSLTPDPRSVIMLLSLCWLK